MVVWTVVNGNWATTTNYSGSTSTSETYFKFTAAATGCRLPGATPSSSALIRSASNRKQITKRILDTDNECFRHYKLTSWGNGTDSYHNQTTGFTLADSWSMSQGGGNHVTGSETGRGKLATTP